MLAHRLRISNNGLWCNWPVDQIFLDLHLLHTIRFETVGTG